MNGIRHLKKGYKKWSKRHPELIEAFKERALLFSEDPFNPLLKTHPLIGKLKNYWAFRITYSERVVFEFLNSKKNHILLIDIGNHNEVY